MVSFPLVFLVGLFRKQAFADRLSYYNGYSIGFQEEKDAFSEKTKNLTSIGSAAQSGKSRQRAIFCWGKVLFRRKNPGRQAPRGPASAVPHPIMTCTKGQVGCRSRRSLLPASTRRRSAGGRSAIPPGSLTSRKRKCGSKRTRHAPSRKRIIHPLLRLRRKAHP